MAAFSEKNSTFCFESFHELSSLLFMFKFHGNRPPEVGDKKSAKKRFSAPFCARPAQGAKSLQGRATWPYVSL